MNFLNHIIQFGIEEEFFISNNTTSQPTEKDLQTEVFTDQIELKTSVCKDVTALFEEIINYRKELRNIYDTGTHPISCLDDIEFLINHKNQELIDELGFPLKLLHTCGCHIHFSIQNYHNPHHLINTLRGFIPFLIAISGNSKTFLRNETKYASFRNHLFGSIPRAGIPPIIDTSIEHFEKSFRINKHSNSTFKNWYDIRFNQNHGTIEFRMFDSNLSLNQIKMYFGFSLVLLCQALQKNNFINEPDYILNENRWRACRFGTDAQLIYNNEIITVNDLGSLIIENNRDIIEYLNIGQLFDKFKAEITI